MTWACWFQHMPGVFPAKSRSGKSASQGWELGLPVTVSLASLSLDFLPFLTEKDGERRPLSRAAVRKRRQCLGVRAWCWAEQAPALGQQLEEREIQPRSRRLGSLGSGPLEAQSFCRREGHQLSHIPSLQCLLDRA